MMSAEDELLVLKKKLAEYESKKKEQKTPEDIIKESRMFGDPPHDQFAHQNRLLWHQKYEPRNQMDLLPEDAILGTIKDNKTLILFQNDNILLNRFYDMGKRSQGIMDLFNSLFYSWWQGMRLTGALGGQERWFQSFETPGIMSGESFSFLEKRAMKKKVKQQGLKNRLLGAMDGGGEEKMYE
jgi:hypothetical protein